MNLLTVKNRHFWCNTIVTIVFRFGDFSALFIFKKKIFINNFVRETFFFAEKNRNSSKFVKKNLLKVKNRLFCCNNVVRIVFRFRDFSLLFFRKNNIYK